MLSAHLGSADEGQPLAARRVPAGATDLLTQLPGGGPAAPGSPEARGPGPPVSMDTLGRAGSAPLAGARGAKVHRRRGPGLRAGPVCHVRSRAGESRCQGRVSFPGPSLLPCVFPGKLRRGLLGGQPTCSSQEPRALVATHLIPVPHGRDDVLTAREEGALCSGFRPTAPCPHPPPWCFLFQGHF